MKLLPPHGSYRGDARELSRGVSVRVDHQCIQSTMRTNRIFAREPKNQAPQENRSLLWAFVGQPTYVLFSKRAQQPHHFWIAGVRFFHESKRLRDSYRRIGILALDECKKHRKLQCRQPKYQCDSSARTDIDEKKGNHVV